MSLLGKELMSHLAAVAKKNLPCSVYILPEAAEYASGFMSWDQMGNSGQLRLKAFTPPEGNLRLIPGESQLRVVYRFGDSLFRFESLLMRVGWEPVCSVLRMPQRIDQLQRRRNAHRVDTGEKQPLVLSFPCEMQSEIPVMRVPSGKGGFFVMLDDPLVLDISRKGLAFQTNYRMDHLKRGELIENAEIRLLTSESFDFVLRVEYVKQLEASHYRFRCGSSIPYLPTEAERWVDRYIQERLQEENGPFN